jgi:ornithine--oxo-acid transaminase
MQVTWRTEAGPARRYCVALRSNGILAKDTHGHTIRIALPLVITAEQVDWALERIEGALRQDAGLRVLPSPRGVDDCIVPNDTPTLESR